MLQLAPVIQRMIDTPVSRIDIQTVFGRLDLPKTYAADVFMDIDDDNQWGLYNAFTGVFSRVETFRAEQWNRQVSRLMMNKEILPM